MKSEDGAKVFGKVRLLEEKIEAMDDINMKLCERIRGLEVKCERFANVNIRICKQVSKLTRWQTGSLDAKNTFFICPFCGRDTFASSMPFGIYCNKCGERIDDLVGEKE